MFSARTSRRGAAAGMSFAASGAGVRLIQFVHIGSPSTMISWISCRHDMYEMQIRDSLPPASMGENHPTIERDPPVVRSRRQGLNAEVRGSAFDHIAKSDLLVAR